MYNSIEDWVLSMQHANASLSYNTRASRMRMRGLSKSANRTLRLIYGLCKPCTVIGLSKGMERSEEENQVRNYSGTTDRILSCIRKQQIEFEDFIHGNYNLNEMSQKAHCELLLTLFHLTFSSLSYYKACISKLHLIILLSK